MSVLKTLMVDTKEAWVEFPGLRGFEVLVANLSRPQLTKLRKDCTYQKFDRKHRVTTEQLDEEKFVAEFTRASVKNWKGLKKAYLESLLPVDLGDDDPNEEVPFSPEDAEALVANSSEFDTWLNETVFDLENFRSA